MKGYEEKPMFVATSPILLTLSGSNFSISTLLILV